MRLWRRIGGLLAALALLASGAVAQVPDAPKNDQPNRQRRPTNQQIRDILLFRALQNRGSSRGIQRGVPQFVPYGNPFFMGMAMQGAQNRQQTGAANDRRTEARSARAERLRQIREETIAKRQEAARKRAAARANGVQNRNP